MSKDGGVAVAGWVTIEACMLYNLWVLPSEDGGRVAKPRIGWRRDGSHAGFRRYETGTFMCFSPTHHNHKRPNQPFHMDESREKWLLAWPSVVVAATAAVRPPHMATLGLITCIAGLVCTGWVKFFFLLNQPLNPIESNAW